MKKGCLFLAAMLLVAGVAGSEAPVAVGDSKAFVLAALGRPTGQARRGATELLFFDAGVVEITNGRVSAVDPEFEAKWEQGKADEAFADEQTAKGLVLWEGQWVTPQQKAKLETAKRRTAAKAPAPPAAGGGNRVEVIRQGGRAIGLENLLVSGGITVVDFFADWCGPCRAMAPRLERLASEQPGVYLRQVDIVNWQSAVAQQYELSSIPNVRVFDRQGRMVGGPTHSFEEVQRNVQTAMGR